MPKKTTNPNFKPDFHCAKCGRDCWGGLSQVIRGKIYCLKCAKEIKQGTR